MWLFLVWCLKKVDFKQRNRIETAFRDTDSPVKCEPCIACCSAHIICSNIQLYNWSNCEVFCLLLFKCSFYEKHESSWRPTRRKICNSVYTWCTTINWIRHSDTYKELLSNRCHGCGFLSGFKPYYIRFRLLARRNGMNLILKRCNDNDLNDKTKEKLAG